LDAVHSEWLHGIYTKYLSTGEATRPRGQGTTIKIGYDVFENGVIKRRLQQGFPEDGEDWTVGHPILFPNVLYVGSEFRTTTQWRVPIDDEHTLHISLYIFKPAPGVKAPEQPVVAWRQVPLTDPEGFYNVRYTFNQDYMAWITQGPIARRDLEKLGESDRGIILYRNLLKDQIAVVEDGGEPMNTFWSEASSSQVHLPMEKIKHGVLPDGKYRAGEAGESADTDLIEQVMASWTDAYAGKQGAEGFAFL
jgi:5,5'-dehydrodivanillate O-demethylase